MCYLITSSVCSCCTLIRLIWQAKSASYFFVLHIYITIFFIFLALNLIFSLNFRNHNFFYQKQGGPNNNISNVFPTPVVTLTIVQKGKAACMCVCIYTNGYCSKWKCLRFHVFFTLVFQAVSLEINLCGDTYIYSFYWKVYEWRDLKFKI